MKNLITPTEKVIPESNIVVFSPHYDDFILTVGGYFLEMKSLGLLETKNIHVFILFSRSNYLAGTGDDNFDKSLDRQKLSTGKRLLEDMECINEILGPYTYRYELAGELECFLREGKTYAESEMEFPHGMFDEFYNEDWEVFERMKTRIRKWAERKDTALIFPTALKEHIDHFIVREAAVQVYTEAKGTLASSFYFHEDKPYGGIADEEELGRLDTFVATNHLQQKVFYYDPEKVIELVFKHYISQVEEVYKKGIRSRGKMLQDRYRGERPCDQLFYPA
jgi:hypothetical protein